jgi:hypothetical protein
MSIDMKSVFPTILAANTLWPTGLHIRLDHEGSPGHHKGLKHMSILSDQGNRCKRPKDPMATLSSSLGFVRTPSG